MSSMVAQAGMPVPPCNFGRPPASIYRRASRPRRDHPMRRRLSGAIVILCLLTCIAASVLWVRSNRPVASLQDQDSLTLTRRDPQYWFVSRGGKLVLCRQVGKDWDQPLPSIKLLGLGFGG